MENYYEILHVANFAEIEVVKAAYRAVTKLYHPDTNSTVDPSIIVKINLAYEVLGDTQKKATYDEQLRSFLKTENKTFNENTNTSGGFNQNKVVLCQDFGHWFCRNSFYQISVVFIYAAVLTAECVL